MKASANIPYLYNGKELQSQLGLQWLDYDARMYDAQVGRWWSVDPMIEKHYDYTAYAYVYNNPIKLIDPFGLDSITGKNEFNLLDEVVDGLQSADRFNISLQGNTYTGGKSDVANSGEINLKQDIPAAIGVLSIMTGVGALFEAGLVGGVTLGAAVLSSIDIAGGILDLTTDKQGNDVIERNVSKTTSASYNGVKFGVSMFSRSKGIIEMSSKGGATLMNTSGILLDSYSTPKDAINMTNNIKDAKKGK